MNNSRQHLKWISFVMHTFVDQLLLLHAFSNMCVKYCMCRIVRVGFRQNGIYVSRLSQTSRLPSIVFTSHQLNYSLKHLENFTYVLYSLLFQKISWASVLQIVHNKFITLLLWERAESKTPPLLSLEVIPASV